MVHRQAESIFAKRKTAMRGDDILEVGGRNTRTSRDHSLLPKQRGEGQTHRRPDLQRPSTVTVPESCDDVCCMSRCSSRYDATGFPQGRYQSPSPRKL
ncbi:hypothetical protein DOTSEDRAFT_73891 [Dothistroma septosporum NZE10]|uniref:Uncharacterized protein n=1 Tax=Dothistroma septosporum (strain NZE10 / CBS 128990) TaxID=675120 RepID=N1PG95_DOTSN|nr:hypothetical protein DOTSEDRAFT_73891 [Dothistroma septosporum NZE10]